MKRPIKIVLVIAIAAISVVVLLFVGQFIYFRYFFHIDLPDDFFGPRPIPGVQPEAWAKLQVGMTKQEVIALLGEPPSRTGPGTTEADGKKEPTSIEFWQYTWWDGLFSGPSDKAHVLYFHPDGTLFLFRGPVTADASLLPPPSAAETATEPGKGP